MDRSRLQELFMEGGYAARIYEGHLFVTVCGHDVLVNLDEEDEDYMQLAYSLPISLPRRVTHSRLANIANGLQHTAKLCKYTYLCKYGGNAMFVVDMELLIDEATLRVKLDRCMQELHAAAMHLEEVVKYRCLRN